MPEQIRRLRAGWPGIPAGHRVDDRAVTHDRTRPSPEANGKEATSPRQLTVRARFTPDVPARPHGTAPATRPPADPGWSWAPHCTRAHHRAPGHPPLTTDGLWPTAILKSLRPCRRPAPLSPQAAYRQFRDEEAGGKSGPPRPRITRPDGVPLWPTAPLRCPVLGAEWPPIS